MPIVKSALAIEATWSIFLCIYWRPFTLESFDSFFGGTFQLGELHIHLGDLGGFLIYFEELVVDLFSWRLDLAPLTHHLPSLMEMSQSLGPIFVGDLYMWP
jgi:hypothetical protein